MGVISHVYVSDPQQKPWTLRLRWAPPFRNTLRRRPRALLGDDSAGTGDRNPPYVPLPVANFNPYSFIVINSNHDRNSFVTFQVFPVNY